jgi:phasin family protein
MTAGKETKLSLDLSATVEKIQELQKANTDFLQRLATDQMEIFNELLDNSVKHFESLRSAKSMQEVFELESKFFFDSTKKITDQGRRLFEAYTTNQPTFFESFPLMTSFITPPPLLAPKTTTPKPAASKPAMPKTSSAAKPAAAKAAKAAKPAAAKAAKPAKPAAAKAAKPAKPAAAKAAKPAKPAAAKAAKPAKPAAPKAGKIGIVLPKEDTDQDKK